MKTHIDTNKDINMDRIYEVYKELVKIMQKHHITYMESLVIVEAMIVTVVSEHCKGCGH